MHRRLRRAIIALTFVSLPLAAVLAYAQSRQVGSPSPPSSSGLDLTAMDRSVDPCTDFHRFACGAWMAANPVPADRGRWGRFDDLQERNLEILRGILETAAAGKHEPTRKIGDYYATCMDEAGINRKGIAALEPDLKNVAALAGVGRLPELLGELHKIGVSAFFSFGSAPDFKDSSTVRAIADQGGLGLPDRDYYFREDTRSVDIRRLYVEHVATMIGLASGGSGAKDAADRIMRLESRLAKAALDNVSRRDPDKIYHKMTPAELQALTPGFDWSRYFRLVGAPPIDAINVTEPEFFTSFNQLLATTPLDDIRTYLRWQLLRASAPMLPSAFVDENFRFYSGALQGIKEQRPRWKRCVQHTDSDLGEALGQAFVNEAFGAQAKTDMLRMVADLERALDRDIATLDWMTPATKKQAAAKLKAISNKIGYPERWRDYRALTIERGDAIGNVQRAAVFEFHRQLTKIGGPVDKTEWSMTPPTVNAYYNPLENNINFPAGILQPPFYGERRDAAANYGGAGAVIGHELTHGFDDSGRKFDAEGNLKDWWTAEDARSFENRTSCLVDQYGALTAVDEVKINGKLTLGENTADNGGVRIALMAYLASDAGRAAATMDGFTPQQRLFLGYAQLWCENRRPEFERLRAQTDPHSPGRYRVNGVVSNMPEFQKAFSCRSDAPMVRQTACRVW